MIRRDDCPENEEAKWAYFVNHCRDNLHIVLAMSPAGDKLRVRCRNFPGLVSNTSIDWFFAWPEEALKSVAEYFLTNVNLDAEFRENITNHIVMTHMSVQKFSVQYEQQFK